MKLRRIITGNDARGRSRVLQDEGPAAEIAAGGSGLYEIWLTGRVPADNRDARDRLAGRDPQLCPPPGGVKVRWFTVAPENRATTPEEQESLAAASFAAVGAADARVDTRRHPNMHRTESVDYIVLVRGEVDLLLDEGEARALGPGDVVVQRGTNHAWVNRGEEPALLVAVLVDAREP